MPTPPTIRKAATQRFLCRLLFVRALTHGTRADIEAAGQSHAWRDHPRSRGVARAAITIANRQERIIVESERQESLDGSLLFPVRWTAGNARARTPTAADGGRRSWQKVVNARLGPPMPSPPRWLHIFLEAARLHPSERRLPHVPVRDRTLLGHGVQGARARPIAFLPNEPESRGIQGVRRLFAARERSVIRRAARAGRRGRRPKPRQGRARSGSSGEASRAAARAPAGEGRRSDARPAG